MKLKWIRKIKYLGLLSLIISYHSTQAQIDPDALGYYGDALKYSRTYISGSARVLGLAGANTALGGDETNISSNPAGLGFFRRSKVSLSPSFFVNNSQAEYLNEITNEGKTTPNIGNVGVVFSLGKHRRNNAKWKEGVIGLSYAKVNSFQSRFQYQAYNKDNSMTDFFVEQANGISYQDLNVPTDDIRNLPELAYMSYMIQNFDDAENAYYSFGRNAVNNKFVRTLQKERVTDTGSQSVWNLSFGGNYNDKIYFGASLGIGFIKYKTRRAYEEKIEGGGELTGFRFIDQLQIKGSGLNFTLGAIYRINNYVRLGASLQSPTWFSMQENYGTAITGEFLGLVDGNGNDIDKTDEATVLGNYNFRLRTPFRFNTGLSIFAGKHGFISADVEFVAYNRSKLSASGFGFKEDNVTIKNIYKPTLNFKLGGEYRYQLFRVRGGFALYQDPYEDIDDEDHKVLFFTGGIGVNTGKIFVDIAGVYYKDRSEFVPYTLQDFSHRAVKLKRNFTNLVITTGLYF